MSHINRLRLMADELRSVNSAVSDETLIVRILQTLPPSYRSFLSAWDSVPRADQTIANLTGRLVTEELRAKTHGGVDPADVAFFATHPNRIHPLQNQHQHSEANAAQGSGWRTNYNRNNQPYNRPNQRGRQRGRGGRGCWNCGMTNHKSYNCRNKKDGERKEARNDQFDRNRDYDPEHEPNNYFAAVSSLCFVARKPTDWYADSGATHHMTDQRSYFSTFKEIGSETWKVNGIGGAQLNALGIGTSLSTHTHVVKE